MDSHRFDALARSLARVPESRRTAVRRLGAGGLAAAAAGLFARTHGQALALAQDAPPAAAPAAPGAVTEFLYIQSHNAGTTLPKEGEAGLYELVITGGTSRMTRSAAVASILGRPDQRGAPSLRRDRAFPDNPFSTTSVPRFG